MRTADPPARGPSPGGRSCPTDNGHRDAQRSSPGNGADAGALRFVHPPGWEGLELCVGAGLSASVPPQFHDWLELRLVRAGAASFAIDRSPHRVRRGALVVIRPGQFSAIDVGPRERVSFLSLCVDPALLSRSAPDGTSSAGELPAVLDDPALGALLLAVRRAMTGSTSAARRRALGDELIAALDGRGLGAPPPAPPANANGERPASILRALDVLRENASQEISLDALAQAAGLSKFHFLRLFASHLGVTPHRYQILLRVARARALLRSGVHIADVAFAAGFYDQSHLTRCFHSVVGVPPRRFQRYDALVPRDA